MGEEKVRGLVRITDGGDIAVVGILLQGVKTPCLAGLHEDEDACLGSLQAEIDDSNSIVVQENISRMIRQQI